MKISVSTWADEVPEADYRPAYVHRFGTGNRWMLDIPAQIVVRVGVDVQLSLDIADARVLVAEIADALALHERAEAAAYRVDLVKAVA
jgi:hypothetical protein